MQGGGREMQGRGVGGWEDGDDVTAADRLDRNDEGRHLIFVHVAVVEWCEN